MGEALLVRKGGSENLDAELTTQESLIDSIEEALVGKATLANATADKILKPYKAYVGKNLITGTYVPQVVKIDGVTVTEDLNLLSALTDFEFPKLPYNFYEGSAVVLNNEIHILGGALSGCRTNHYKFNGTSWTKVSTLPYEFYDGSAVVLNNEIHILGGSGGDQNHYKFNGTSWTKVSTLPSKFYCGSAVVLNNEIHILGGFIYNTTGHYKLNGTSWTKVSTLPYEFYYGSAVVLNNKIHILGGEGSTYGGYHRSLNGTSWTKVSTLPYTFTRGSAVVLNNEIHIMGSDALTDYYEYHYNINKGNKLNKLPYRFYDGSAVVLNNEIHILGGNDNTDIAFTLHYGLNATVYHKA